MMHGCPIILYAISCRKHIGLQGVMDKRKGIQCLTTALATLHLLLRYPGGSGGCTASGLWSKRRFNIQYFKPTIMRRTLAVFSFVASLAFFSVLALEMALARRAARAVEVWFRRSAMVFKSAPTMPRWCLTVLRERFLATSSVMPFLCMRRYTTVQAILRGFLRWRKRDSDLEVEKRKI